MGGGGGGGGADDGSDGDEDTEQQGRPGASGDLASAAADGVPSVEDGVSERNTRLLLHLYKARLHLDARALKPVKREIKAALVLNRHSAAAVMSKAHLEYIRGGHKKAARLLHTSHKLLVAAGAEAPAGGPEYLNNLACVYLRYGKHAASTAALAHALTLADPLRPAVRDAIAYNLGVELLVHGGDPAGGYASLALVARSFAADRPLYWLRVAEACIAVHHRASAQARAVTRLADGRVQLPVADLDPGPAGSLDSTDGAHSSPPPRYRRALPVGACARLRSAWADAETSGRGDGVDGRPTLAYAQRCLLNARILLDRASNPPSDVRAAVHCAYTCPSCRAARPSRLSSFL